MILIDQNRLGRIIRRMAYQVVENSGGGNINMVGLNERGYAVASLMQNHISENADHKVHLMQLFVENMENRPEKLTKKNPGLVVVDDVIFSGRTMFRALNQIPELYDYDNVYVASVIDRGHRKLPVLAGIVGLTVPTKANEHVDFQLKNNRPHKVLLTKK